MLKSDYQPCLWILVALNLWGHTKIIIIGANVSGPQIRRSQQTSVSENKNHGEEDAWQLIHSRIFAFKGEPLGPEETLRLLRRLNQLQPGKLDRDERQSLIDKGEIHETKCNRSDYISDKLIAMYERHAIFRLNIVPYLRYFKWKQLELCKRRLARILNQAEAVISESDKRTITLIRASLLDTNFYESEMKLGFCVPYAMLTNGLALFMENQGRLRSYIGFDRRIDTRYNYSIDFKYLVREICKKISSKLSSEMFEFEEPEIIYQQLRTNEIDWLEKVKICEYILYRFPTDLVEYDSYIDLLKRHPDQTRAHHRHTSFKRRLRRFFLNCFRPKEYLFE